MDESVEFGTRPQPVTLHGGAGGGGAWKVAYADFVTAMMALFIVLWLLNSSEETKAAVSAYFNNPSIFAGEGRGFLNQEGMMDLREQLQQIEAKQAAESEGPQAGVSQEMLDMDREFLQNSAQELEEILKQSPALHQFEGQVSMEMTADGLRIQVHDEEFRPLFDVGSDRVSQESQELLSSIAQVLSKLPNPVIVEGHTDSRPFQGGDATNWDLSAQRANAARRLLEANGVDPTRIARVVGFADRKPLDPEKPFSAKNRRISFIVRYQSSEPMNR